MTSSIVRCEIRPFEATNEYDAREKGDNENDHCITIVVYTVQRAHKHTGKIHFKTKETLKYTFSCFVIVDFGFCIAVDT